MTDLVTRAVLHIGQGSASTQSAPNIRDIPLDLIDANDNNFYSVNDVTDLKDSIELIGLQQPLVVCLSGDRYRLIVGHRRLRALTELGRKTASCIVQDAPTETVEQLILILSNSTARELTYAEKIQQAAKLKELFVRSKKEGAKLPGRIRDMVADAMQESASNIAKMDAIDKHLIPDWQTELKNNRLNASTAYELSKLPDAVQQKLKNQHETGLVLTTQAIKAAENMADYPFAPLDCPLHHTYPCTGYAKRADMVTAGSCPGCCNKCDHQNGCPALCGLCKTQIDRETASIRQKEKDQKAEEAYQQSAYRQAQLSLMQWAKSKRFDAMQDWGALPYVVQFYRNAPNASRNQWTPNLKDLFDLAELLKITLPELLGLTPPLPPCTSEWHKYPQDKPDDGDTVLCRYSKYQQFDLLVYQGGTFGQIIDDDFVSLDLEVKYWTRAYPDD